MIVVSKGTTDFLVMLTYGTVINLHPEEFQDLCPLPNAASEAGTKMSLPITSPAQVLPLTRVAKPKKLRALQARATSDKIPVFTSLLPQANHQEI